MTTGLLTVTDSDAIVVGLAGVAGTWGCVGFTTGAWGGRFITGGDGTGDKIVCSWFFTCCFGFVSCAFGGLVGELISFAFVDLLTETLDSEVPIKKPMPSSTAIKRMPNPILLFFLKKSTKLLFEEVPFESLMFSSSSKFVSSNSLDEI